MRQWVVFREGKKKEVPRGEVRKLEEGTAAASS